MKKFSSATAWIIVLIMVFLAALAILQNGKTANIIPFNDFQKQWIGNNINEFEVRAARMTVAGTLKDGTKYETIVPSERLYQFIGQNPKIR